MTNDPSGLEAILEKIYGERGFDFREYRVSTLERRIGRRMRFRHAETYSEYAQVLDQDPEEYVRLFNDLTINVTRFFRDEIAFKTLGEKVLPVLIKRSHANGGEFCIWSAGCAIGAEPYSIAMLLLKSGGGDAVRGEKTILATDIDPKALDRAREGVFSPREVEGLRPEWLADYFEHEGDGFRISPAVRKMVTFQRHDLTGDSPIWNVDMVVCRNVMIYFVPSLQARVLGNFHKGLKPGGLLLLGKAEAPTKETQDLFSCLDKKAKLYQKNELRHILNSRIQKVVVVAASAGGIAAVTQLVSRLPASLPAAVIVVQHLRENRPTRLPEHLDRVSPFRVRLAQQGMPLEPGVVYIAEPGKHLTIEKGCLMLDSDKKVHYVRPSADVLFISAAKAFGPDLIGVVLSGTGKDGALGCKEIKAKGGTTMAQDKESAAYFGMPQAAIDLGVVDYVLPVKDIGAKIVERIGRTKERKKDEGRRTNGEEQPLNC